VLNHIVVNLLVDCGWCYVAAGELFTVFRCHWLFTTSIDCYSSLSAFCTQPTYHQLLLQGIALYDL